MKRTSKILAVVLSLALICGAFVVSAFAANDDSVKGIVVKRTQDYDGLTPDWGGSASSGNPTGDVYSWTLKDRIGTASIGVGADGNQYLIFTQTDKVAATGPYFGTGYGGAGTTARPTLSDGLLTTGGDIKDYPFLVFDFDFMSPTGKFATTSVKLEMRSFFKGNDSLQMLEYSAQTPITFASDEGGCYIYYGFDKENTKTYVNPYEFNHVTIVYESVVTETYRSINAHVYLNNELWTSIESGDPGYEYYNDTPHANFDEVRFNFSTVDDANCSIALDNVVTRLMTAEYNGTLKDVVDSKASLDTWESNIYDPANKPLGIAVAELNGVMYDDLQKAVDAAREGDTINIIKDCTKKVVVNKLITVNGGDYIVNLAGAENFGVKSMGDGVYVVVSTSGRQVSVYWDDCYCDEICSDEDMAKNHPLYNYAAKVDLYAKLMDVYSPYYMDFKRGDGYLYELVGWLKLDPNFDGEIKGELLADDPNLSAYGTLINGNTEVTYDDISNRYIELVPVYEKILPVYEYVKGGVLTYADNAKGLATVIGEADKDTTVKLIGDATVSSVADIKKNITFDLNGHRLTAVTSDGATAKFSIFKIPSGSFTFTLTSSVAGGEIFCQGANSAGSSANGSTGIINISGNGANVVIKGNDAKGNNTLTCYSSVIVESYSSALSSFEVDGGVYIATKTDQMGFFDFRNANKVSVFKNAFICNTASEQLISFPGRNHTYDADNPTCIIDNCVLIGSITSLVAPVTMTITNTYINGKLDPQVKGYAEDATTKVPNAVGAIILGAGNKINGSVSASVALADGISMVGAPAELKVSYYKNTWTFAGGICASSSFDLEKVEETLVFNSLTTDKTPITVTWKDHEGNVLGTNTGVPGFAVAAPNNLKPSYVAVKGWLNAIPAEWDTSLIIPEDATSYEIYAKEGGAVQLVAAVDLLFNINLQTHFQYNMYVPDRAEGIEVTAVNLRGDRLKDYNDRYNTKLVINGNNYTLVTGWPGLKNAAAENSTFGITFTYKGETYSVSANMNVVKYCEYIFDSGLYTGEALNLAANVANYVYEGCKYLGDTASAEKLEEIVKNNTSKIYTPTEEELNAYPSEAEITALKKYAKDLTIVVLDYGPRFRLNLTEAGKAATIVLYAGNSTTKIAHGDTDTQEEYSAKGYIETNNTHLRSLNATRIVITPADGSEKVEITFSLANYCKALENEDAKTLSFLYAMYGYAKAAEVYQQVQNNQNA